VGADSGPSAIFGVASCKPTGSGRGELRWLVLALCAGAGAAIASANLAKWGSMGSAPPRGELRPLVRALVGTLTGPLEARLAAPLGVPLRTT
jgi:hypothetical protein